jgi:hypothetical protein
MMKRKKQESTQMRSRALRSAAQPRASAAAQRSALRAALRPPRCAPVLRRQRYVMQPNLLGAAFILCSTLL